MVAELLKEVGDLAVNLVGRAYYPPAVVDRHDHRPREQVDKVRELCREIGVEMLQPGKLAAKVVEGDLLVAVAAHREGRL